MNSLRKIAFVILAAGKGKRMKNPERSKVMFCLKEKPMIQYVVELTQKVESECIVIVVGHKKEFVMEFLTNKFKAENILFASQDEQLGTGHAVMQTSNHLKDFDGSIFILSGDVPLLSVKTVNDFTDFHFKNGFNASLISAYMDDPAGYGRILRNEYGDFYDIREEKDCNNDEKKVKEINSGIYLIDSKILFDSLKKLDKENAQGEYYLTDIFKIFKEDGLSIGAFPVNNVIEITGINTIEQLEQMEKLI